MKNYFEHVYKSTIKKLNVNFKYDQIREDKLQIILIAILATSPFMWAYAFIAIFSIPNKTPAIVGVIASFTHISSIALRRWNINPQHIIDLALLSGLIHQATFSYYTGGFESNIIIWFGLLPIIGGITCGNKAAIKWFIITICVLTIFFIAEITGYHFPNIISYNGNLVGQALIAFGLISLTTTLTWISLYIVKKNNRALREKNQEIQNLNFILSHDLNNPLTIAQLNLKYFNQENLTPKQIKLLENTAHSVNTMIEIVDNTKNLLSINYGKQDIIKTKIDLDKTFLEVKKNFEIKLKDKNIILNFVNYNDHSDFYTNQSLFTYQILSNLISNAIKFSKQDNSIIVKYYTDEFNHFISVKDYGIGIPNELQKTIFDMDKKTNRAGTSGEKGTGFGLPLVKTYVEKLDGKISLKSNCNANIAETGTEFIISFPKQPQRLAA